MHAIITLERCLNQFISRIKSIQESHQKSTTTTRCMALTPAQSGPADTRFIEDIYHLLSVWLPLLIFPIRLL